MKFGRQIRTILGVQHHEEGVRERVGAHSDGVQTERGCRLHGVLYTEPDAQNLRRKNQCERERNRHYWCQDALGSSTKLIETLTLARRLDGCQGWQQAPE